MPRLIVVIAALFIVAAAGFGGYEGYSATLPGPALQVPPALVPISLSTPSAGGATTGAYDERTVRQIARREVQALIAAHAPPVETVTSAPAVVEASAELEPAAAAPSPVVNAVAPEAPAPAEPEAAEIG